MTNLQLNLSWAKEAEKHPKNDAALFCFLSTSFSCWPCSPCCQIESNHFWPFPAPVLRQKTWSTSDWTFFCLFARPFETLSWVCPGRPPHRRSPSSRHDSVPKFDESLMKQVLARKSHFCLGKNSFHFECHKAKIIEHSTYKKSITVQLVSRFTSLDSMPTSENTILSSLVKSNLVIVENSYLSPL